jgi:hypothetical protein
MTKQVSSTAPTDKAPEKVPMSKKDAAALAKISEKKIFAVNEYADRIHVITVDGQKIVVTL